MSEGSDNVEEAPGGVNKVCANKRMTLFNSHPSSSGTA